MSRTRSHFGHSFLGLGLGLATLATTGSASANGGVYLESGGLVVIQIESAPPSGWTFSTQTPGYSGLGYFRWDGPDLFASPGTDGIFSFDIEISTPGTYIVNLRNRHEDPNPTEDNDVWVRIDGGTWEKVFSNGASSVGQWTWESQTETGPTLSHHFSVGLHTLWFSARSEGFKMDRVHLAVPGHPNAFNGGLPESQCRIGVQYGVANPNSTGAVGLMEAIGSLAVVRNNVTLHGYQLPVNALGYFIVSSGQIFLANPGGSSGNVLVGPTIGRYRGNLISVNGAGRVSMPIDLTQIAQPNGSVATLPGQTWNFQFWHRDSSPGGMPTSNLTSGLALTFN